MVAKAVGAGRFTYKEVSRCLEYWCRIGVSMLKRIWVSDSGAKSSRQEHSVSHYCFVYKQIANISFF